MYTIYQLKNLLVENFWSCLELHSNNIAENLLYFQIFSFNITQLAFTREESL